MPLAQAPVSTSLVVSGLGIWVSRQDAFGQTPLMLGRKVIDDPDNSGDYDLGFPFYQMVLFKDQVQTDWDHTVLLHAHNISKVIAIPASTSFDANSTPAHFTHIDVSAHTFDGMAMAAFIHSDTTKYTILDVPEAGSKLGISIFSGLGGHTSAATPDISGATLGFDSTHTTDGRWTGFVVAETENGNVRVLGGLELIQSRFGPGDLTKSEVYTFVIDPALKTVIEPAEKVDVDVPFTPHSLVSGQTTSLDSSARKTLFWVAGRTDPEFYNATVSPLTGGSSREFTNAGSVGIWVTDDPNLKNFRQSWVSPSGVSHPPTHHIQTTIGSGIPSRDLGIVFDEAWQRNILFGIDTDPSQDPVSQRPDRQFTLTP